jgi:hypothetical protein
MITCSMIIYTSSRRGAGYRGLHAHAQGSHSHSSYLTIFLRAHVPIASKRSS